MKDQPALLFYLYNSTSDKYLKYRHRIDKAIQNGRFRKFSKRKRSSLLHRLKKLFAKIKRLHFQLKVAMAGAAASLAFSLINPAEAQTTIGPFVQKSRTENPLRWPFTTFYQTRPASVDWDNDGDLDVVVGERYDFRYFENVGAATKPSFEERTGEDNPFSGLNSGDQYDTAPTFVDFDMDGDMDLFAGSDYSAYDAIAYFKNDNGTLTRQNPNDPWDDVAKTGNPFLQVSQDNTIQPHTKLCFVDLDKDGDLDVFIGLDHESDALHYYRNDLNIDGAFHREGIAPIRGSYNEAPQMADFDNDGDLDLFVGSNYGSIDYFVNDGSNVFTQQSGEWDFSTKEGNPFENFSYQKPVPHFVDLDNDGDLDVIIGREKIFKYGTRLETDLVYLQNQGNAEFIELTGLQNPFGGVLSSEGNHYTKFGVPAFVDTDNDGDLDFVLGEKYPTYNDIRYFKNVNGEYFEQFNDDNIFQNIILGSQTHPRVADVNGDGFNDIFVGQYPGIKLLVNNKDGTFHLADDTENPFSSLSTSYQYDLAFVDIDKDTDLDAFIARNNNILFYRNTGTTADPVFEEDAANNPFATASYSGNVAIHSADINGDGNSDIIIGSSSNSIKTFVNNGDQTFSEVTGIDNPFSDINYNESKPVFVDYDKDGDLDSFIGNYDGKIYFFVNENPRPVISTEVTSVQFSPGGDPVIIDGQIALTDVDDDVIQNAFVSIKSYEPGLEQLVVIGILPEGIQSDFDGSTGVLTFSGSAYVDDYALALQSVAYQYTGNLQGNGQNKHTGDKKGNSQARTISKTVQFQVFDMDRTIGPPTLFAMSHLNDIPVLTSTAPDITYVPFSGSVILDNTITVADNDDPNIASATVSVKTGFQSGQDVLQFTSQNGITGSYDASTGVLTLTGNALLSDYQTAIQSIKYTNGSLPNGTPRSIEYIVNDGESNSAPETLSINFNMPPVVTRSVTFATFVTTAVVLDNAITVTDDGATLASATISILAGFQSAEDQLQFTNQNGISGTYDPTTGVLTLAGNAPKADYQTALRSIKYNNISSAPNITNRTIEFKVSDGANTSAAETLSLFFTPPVPPALSSAVASVNYVSGQLPINTGITIADPDDVNLESATVTISTGLVPGEDVLSFTASGSITGNYISATGILSLSGTATLATYQTVLRSVTYENTNPGDRNKGPRIITFIVNDGVLNSNLLSSSLNIPNQVPVISNPSAPPLYGTVPVFFADQLVLSDNDNATLQSAAVTITTNLKPTEDLLLFTNQNGISGVYTASNGTLQLTGSSSKSNYQAALRSIQYQNTLSALSELPRTISITVNDGINSSAAATATINIDKAPVITPELPISEAGAAILIDLSGIVSDVDNNLDLSKMNSVSILSQPKSGAVASIVNVQLRVDYSSIPNFTGLDQLTIQVCDNLDRCTAKDISIQVGAELQIYNAVSANNDGINDFLYLRYIKPDNKVTIYNRWGDKVFAIENYDNNTPGKRFEGFNNNGNELPSGTYFYKIEYSGALLTTGYLALKK